MRLHLMTSSQAARPLQVVVTCRIKTAHTPVSAVESDAYKAIVLIELSTTETGFFLCSNCTTTLLSTFCGVPHRVSFQTSPTRLTIPKTFAKPYKFILKQLAMPSITWLARLNSNLISRIVALTASNSVKLTTS
eukprot:544249-Hanusia_phi.AAC.1